MSRNCAEGFNLGCEVVVAGWIARIHLTLPVAERVWTFRHQIYRTLQMPDIKRLEQNLAAM